MNITVEELINNIDKYITIDVRSPKEFLDGTIKDSINMPILDNDARHIVGSLYKVNKDEAYKEGLKIGTARLPEMYDKISKLKKEHPEKEIVIFCFRGGTRSSSVVQVMNMMKLNCYKLDGGHKEYRKYILENMDNYINKLNYLVVTGNTGSGKTIVLNKLYTNYPVLDLEGYASHRGSIFGEVGLKGNTQKTFEDKLFFELKRIVDSKKTDVFVESESRRIGYVTMPNLLYDKLISAPHLLLDVSVEKRVSILEEVYNIETVDTKYIKELISKNKYFKENLGKDWIEKMNEYLDNADFHSFIESMIVDYYDKLYLKSQKKYNYDLIIKSDDLDEIVKKLSEYYDKKN